MVERTLAGSLGLSGGWTAGEDGWHTGMASNLLWLSVLVQGRFVDQVTAEPGSPAEGAVYILSAGHATHPNELAVFDNGAWLYRAPLAGWRLFNTTLGIFSQFDGTAWLNDTAGLNAENVRDIMAAALVSGTNVTVVPDDAADTITLNAVGGGGGLDAEGVRDVIGAALTASGLATVNVNDAADTIDIGATGDGTGLTAEQVMDIIAGMIAAGSNVTVTYNDASDTLTIAAAGSAGVVRPITVQVLTTPPAASEILGTYPAVDAFTIPANFAGSASTVISNPSATFTIDVQRQVGGTGAFTSIGTITVSAAGAVTWATAGGVSVAIAALDVLKFVADSDGDATFLGAFTVKGNG